MAKSPKEMPAEFEAMQAEMEAELEKLGIPPLGDGDFDEEAALAGYPEILRAIHECEQAELIPALTQLLENGADPNAESPYGETAAGECFRSGSWAALVLLLDHGAKIGSLAFEPMHLAMLRGELPDFPDPMARDDTGRTPFLFACRVGNLDAAKALLPVTPDEGRIAVPDQYGPVWMAVRSNSPDMINWVLAEGFDVNRRSRFGGTPLLEAVEWDKVGIASTLLEAGADLTLGENVSASLRASDAENPKSKSIFAKAADLIMSKTPVPADMPDTISTPASSAHSSEMVRLLVAQGADVTDFDDDMVPFALGTDRIEPVTVSAKAFNRHGTTRSGNSNPEAYLPDFWREQIRTGRSGYAAAVEILGEREFDSPAIPVWSFQRFGRTATALPDGRLVLVAGEHEDSYDPDFCIYADLTVVDGKGGIEHFIYPKDVFPPTDFHTATLLGDHILLIGSLGYGGQRQEGVTQVLRLNLDDFSIHSVETSGENPGWINRHKAVLGGGKILVTGGKIEPGFKDNPDAFELDLETMVWTRLQGDL